MGLGLPELLIHPLLSAGLSIIGYLQKLKSYGTSDQVFGLIFFNRRLQVVLDGKSSREYPTKAVLLQGAILGPRSFLI